MKSDAFSPAFPGAQRAVQEAADALRSRGHELVEVTLPNFEKLFELYIGWGGCAGVDGQLQALMGEELVSDFQASVFMQDSWSLRRILELKLIQLFGESKERIHSIFLRHARRLSASEYRELVFQTAVEREKLVAWFDATRISVFLCPIFGGAQTRQGTSQKTIGTQAYAANFNVANLPAGVVPVTLVREDEQHHDDLVPGFYTRNILNELAQGSKGLPLAVQVVAPPFQEELCLRVMKEIDEVIQFREKPAYLKQFEQ